MLISFDDIIVDVLSNKKLDRTVTKLFIRGRKLNISPFIKQSYFAVLKNIRQNSMHYFIMKLPKKRELQRIAFNHASDIDFKDLVNTYKRCTAKTYSVVVIDNLDVYR